MGSRSEAIRYCEAHAAGNHGVIPRKVAVSAGLDDSAITRLLNAGRWRRLFARAYVDAGAPTTWYTRLAAIAANVEEDFAFSHRTAGGLLGLDGVDEGSLEIVTRRSLELKGVTVHRIRSSLPRVIHVHGFPVTAAQRTVLDLFSVLSRGKAELALEDALRKKLTTIDRLWSEYAATCGKGRNGCRDFRNALLRRDHADGTLQSRMEAKLRRIINGLPPPSPIPQFEVNTPAGRYFIDFAYPDIKLGIEAHSIKWHMGEARFFYDLKRDRNLKRCGWTTLYYSWDDLLHPSEVHEEIADLRSSLADVL
ncbi:MAG: DUF559 domain-containing protein [Actinomycetota bacterium]|nr:DUF559 domain-containing protein [Actinomycetota bacterium]